MELTNTNAKKSDIISAIAWLATNADSNDISLLYFAGHGSQDSASEYIRAYDDPISDKDLDGMIGTIDGTIVVIIDACHSGGFIEDLRSPGRIILTACRASENTYQVHELKSGIFGYFINSSMQQFTTHVETTFLVTWFSSLRYSIELSKQLNDSSYIIHPQMFDGTILPIRLTQRTFPTMNTISTLFLSPDRIERTNIWKMNAGVNQSTIN